jgi:HD-like signal output (HDOD) protein
MTPQSLAAEVSSLFALPDVVLRVQALLDKPDVNAREISAAVELDAGLATAVLHLANSVLYGQHGRVDTVARAIDLIGRRTLREMVLATSVVKVFRHIPEQFVDMATFWDNSITCGVVARLLGRRIRMQDADSLFLAGLLHGVGRLVFYARRPDQYRELLAAGPAGEKALVASERATFGFDYAELGAALLTNWSLPQRLCFAIANQNELIGAPAGFIREVAIIHVANDVAASLAPCLKQQASPETYEPGFDPAAREILNISQEDLDAVRLETLAQTFDIIEIINPGSALIY